ncbi:uncharacterized protein AC631_00473 [Debaryomyces fabryi]|uniref:Uncharacterized protein n=1 Tax=Debaryomyces fabryi TaxID=58627 RepID=A0A0V1Q5P1_9ASCO|nr:uncharacterized protein AC631_00473 [Debaryomyces fabryi]KSA03838.1 hypothetical protein AC631_00473 [Debaryomyces fabryi]CUM45358.1 unnamed protein product [Debaryomyces fabryi]
MLTRTINKTVASYSTKRLLHSSLPRFVKNDDSTIDSYRMPSQTSINEWEFKYDFIPKVAEPKVPPLTREAIKQDIANEKKAQVEKEMLNLEVISVKAEANDAPVLHGGEAVAAEPEFLHDRGSEPVDASYASPRESAKPKKPANREKYIQTSINPQINQSEVVNLGASDVDHKSSNVEQSRVVDDIEHDNLHTLGQKNSNKSGFGVGVPLALLGLGAGGYYYYQTSESDSHKK